MDDFEYQNGQGGQSRQVICQVRQTEQALAGGPYIQAGRWTVWQVDRLDRQEDKMAGVCICRTGNLTDR